MTTQTAPAGTSPATGTGAIVHTGLFFVPPLVLAVGGAALWREQSGARQEGR